MSKSEKLKFIQGFLSAFATLNSYTNHVADFAFISIPINGDSKNSLNSYLAPQVSVDNLEEIPPDISLLKDSFKEWLFDIKPGFSDRYGQMEDYNLVSEDCSIQLSEILQDFFSNENIKIFRMSVDESKNYYESIYDDYVFDTGSELYNLHFGVSD